MFEADLQLLPCLMELRIQYIWLDRKILIQLLWVIILLFETFRQRECENKREREGRNKRGIVT